MEMNDILDLLEEIEQRIEDLDTVAFEDLKAEYGHLEEMCTTVEDALAEMTLQVEHFDETFYQDEEQSCPQPLQSQDDDSGMLKDEGPELLDSKATMTSEEDPSSLPSSEIPLFLDFGFEDNKDEN